MKWIKEKHEKISPLMLHKVSRKGKTAELFELVIYDEGNNKLYRNQFGIRSILDQSISPNSRMIEILTWVKNISEEIISVLERERDNAY